jgi:hypothetical protein
MKLPRRNFLHLAAGAAALPAVTRTAWAQAYPSRPVRIIVGFAPAGGTDIMARLIGERLSERLGQQFVIENRPGAASNVASFDGRRSGVAPPIADHPPRSAAPTTAAPVRGSAPAPRPAPAAGVKEAATWAAS